MSKQNTTKGDRYLAALRKEFQRKLDDVPSTNYREVVQRASSHQRLPQQPTLSQHSQIFRRARYRISRVFSPLLNWGRSHRMFASCVITATAAVCILLAAVLLVQYQQYQLVAPLFSHMQSIAIDYSLVLY